MKFKLLLAASALTLASVTTAQAADHALGHKAPVIVTPAFSWEGFYVGAQAGYGFNKSKSDYLIKKVKDAIKAKEDKDNDDHHKDDPTTYSAGFEKDFTSSDEGDLKGFIGGLYAGYSMPVVDDAIVGVETDFAFNKADSKFTQKMTVKYRKGGTSSAFDDTKLAVSGETKTKWSGATRLRVGYALDKILPYLAGGVAYTNLETSGLVATDATAPETIAKIAAKDHTLIGWTAGAGVDYAALDNVVVRLEYRYNNYGTKDITAKAAQGQQTLDLKKQFSSNDVRVGIAYKF